MREISVVMISFGPMRARGPMTIISDHILESGKEKASNHISWTLHQHPSDSAVAISLSPAINSTRQRVSAPGYGPTSDMTNTAAEASTPQQLTPKHTTYQKQTQRRCAYTSIRTTMGAP